MAFDKITFTNPQTGKTKKAPVGFSWTVLFFGPFPAFFRGDWKWGLIMLLAFLLTAGLSDLVFMFIYNKLYIKGLIARGYQASGVEVGPWEKVTAALKGVDIPVAQPAA